jgi:hypothetical protein
MPRFVLLYHDCPPGYARPSHWDLMLESGDGLETWALARLPRSWQAAHVRTLSAFANCAAISVSDTVTAEHLAKHRLAFLDYEGPVSGGRGNVVRVASGTFCMSERTESARKLVFDAGTINGHLWVEQFGVNDVTWQLRAFD